MLYPYTSELVTHKFWALVARNDTEKHFLSRNKLEKMSKKEILFLFRSKSFFEIIIFRVLLFTDF